MLVKPDVDLHHVMVNIPDDLYITLQSAATTKGISVEALLIESARSAAGLGPTPRLAPEILRAKLIDVLNAYVEEGINSKGYLTVSVDQIVFAAIHIGQTLTERFVKTGIVARVVDDIIVIEVDKTDRPVVEALLSVGVPRIQTILAYKGEPLPNTV